MRTFSLCGKTVSVCSGDVPGAPAVYLNAFSDEGQQAFQAVQDAGGPAFTLVTVSGLDWDRDMAPWDCPAVFKNAQPFVGGAGNYLRLLTEKIVPEAEKELPTPPRWRGIAGYSLAGLFAVYALYQTDVFSRAASMSGSLWFPGMKWYVFSREWKRPPDGVYFSLGDKENRTRNPVLKSVRQDSEEIEALYQSKGVDTAFQLNPGNHYDRAAERTAAGIAWILNRAKKTV